MPRRHAPSVGPADAKAAQTAHTARRPREAVPSGTTLHRPHWGLQLAPGGPAARVERAWRLPVVLALCATIPAFYAELLAAASPPAALLAYLLAALVTGGALAHTTRRCARPRRHLASNPVDLVLVVGLLLAAALPPSVGSNAALALRLVVSMLTLLRILWAMQQFITRGGLAYLLVLALGVLGLCGAGFWWLEPSTPTFADGLWLAFTTAATVGYGDAVPTTAASKIFAVFVVLLGFGVLTMVTAAIAASWVETEERRIEREILRDLRQQMDGLRQELRALRNEAHASAQLQAQDRERQQAPALGSKRQPP